MIDFDLDAMIERERRRQDALAAGSTHIPIAQRTFAGPRPDAVSSLDAPEYRWPSQQHLLPKRCTYCGSPGLSTDPPYGLVKFGETVCLLCSRVVVRWKADGTRTIKELAAGFGAIPAPKRGRPPKDRTEAQRQANREMYARQREQPKRLCATCQTRTAKTGRVRCHACIRDREAEQLHRVLVRVMTPGVPMSSAKLRALLGIADTSITRIVTRAQRGGAPITCVKHGWFRLEVTP